MSESYFQHVEFQILAYALAVFAVVSIGYFGAIGAGKVIDWFSRATRLQHTSDVTTGENTTDISRQSTKP